MFQLIDAWDMKIGDMYFLKKHQRIIGDVIFIKYNMTPSGQQFATVTYPYTSGYSYLMLSVISVYRYVSEEEYWEKVKEKYDAKCLDIILKRLVDDSFQWL